MANDDAEVTRIQDLIRGCPIQAKIAIDVRVRQHIAGILDS